MQKSPCQKPPSQKQKGIQHQLSKITSENYEFLQELGEKMDIIISNTVQSGWRWNTECRNSYLQNTDRQIRNAEHRTDNPEWENTEQHIETGKAVRREAW